MSFIQNISNGSKSAKSIGGETTISDFSPDNPFANAHATPKFSQVMSTLDEAVAGMPKEENGFLGKITKLLGF